MEPAPRSHLELNADPAALADTERANQGAQVQTFAATTPAPVTPLPPPSAPGSKPAIAKNQKPDKTKRPLDKMEAETGLLYDPKPGRSDELDEFASAQSDNVGGLGDNNGDGAGVGVEYADPPQITDVTDPPVAVAAQGKRIEEKAVDRAESPPEGPFSTAPEIPAPQPIYEPFPEPEPEPVPVPSVSAQITYAEVLEGERAPVIYGPITHPPHPPDPAPPPPPQPLPEINVILEKRTTPPPTGVIIGDRPVPYVVPQPPPPPPPPPVIIAPPPFEPRFDYDGRYVVQIASFRNVEAACAVWDDLRIDFPRLFDNAETIVRPHRTGSGKLLHRLRVGAFAKRHYAVEWCQAYQDEGGECFVTRR